MIALAVLAGCEPDADEAVRSDGFAETLPTVTVPAPTTTVAPTTTTTTTAKPKPAPTTTTTAKPRPRPTTTTTAEPAPAPATSSSCHPSYRGTCIPPDVSDADCAGGTGNGPWYVQEKDIEVIGTDVFGLDGNDNDGVGCES